MLSNSLADRWHLKHTLRLQKYGNEGPKNALSKMAYNSAGKAFNCFSIVVIADVTKTNSYVNKRFYFQNMPDFSSYSFVIQE